RCLREKACEVLFGYPIWWDQLYDRLRDEKSVVTLTPPNKILKRLIFWLARSEPELPKRRAIAWRSFLGGRDFPNIVGRSNFHIVSPPKWSHQKRKSETKMEVSSSPIRPSLEGA